MVEEEKIRGIVTLNEDFETEGITNSTEVTKAVFLISVLELSTIVSARHLSPLDWMLYAIKHPLYVLYSLCPIIISIYPFYYRNGNLWALNSLSYPPLILWPHLVKNSSIKEFHLFWNTDNNSTVFMFIVKQDEHVALQL